MLPARLANYDGLINLIVDALLREVCAPTDMPLHGGTAEEAGEAKRGCNQERDTDRRADQP